MLTFDRMGNGGVLDGGDGQLGVCHTTGCRYNPPSMSIDMYAQLMFLICPGVTLAMHLLVDPKESLILTTVGTVMMSLSSSPQSQQVPTSTPVRSWNPLLLTATGRSLPGRQAGQHPND